MQTCVNQYMKEKYLVDYVDTITLAGPCQVLAEGERQGLIDNIRFRIDISVNQHHSKVIAIVGHTDCAAVKVSDDEQKALVLQSVEVVKQWGLDVIVVGLWVDESWTVKEIIKKELINV